MITSVAAMMRNRVPRRASRCSAMGILSSFLQSQIGNHCSSRSQNENRQPTDGRFETFSFLKTPVDSRRKGQPTPKLKSQTFFRDIAADSGTSLGRVQYSNGGSQDTPNEHPL